MISGVHNFIVDPCWNLREGGQPSGGDPALSADAAIMPPASFSLFFYLTAMERGVSVMVKRMAQDLSSVPEV